MCAFFFSSSFFTNSLIYLCARLPTTSDPSVDTVRACIIISNNTSNISIVIHVPWLVLSLCSFLAEPKFYFLLIFFAELPPYTVYSCNTSISISNALRSVQHFTTGTGVPHKLKSGFNNTDGLLQPLPIQFESEKVPKYTMTCILTSLSCAMS